MTIKQWQSRWMWIVQKDYGYGISMCVCIAISSKKRHQPNTIINNKKNMASENVWALFALRNICVFNAHILMHGTNNGCCWYCYRRYLNRRCCCTLSLSSLGEEYRRILIDSIRAIEYEGNKMKKNDSARHIETFIYVSNKTQYVCYFKNRHTHTHKKKHDQTKRRIIRNRNCNQRQSMHNNSTFHKVSANDENCADCWYCYLFGLLQ